MYIQIYIRIIQNKTHSSTFQVVRGYNLLNDYDQQTEY